MKSIPALFLAVSFVAVCSAQSPISTRNQLSKAQEDLQTATTDFSNCIVKSNSKICIDNLVSNATNEYMKYVVGSILYKIDTFQSFKLHQEAYLANPQEQNFILEYAIELHRKREYAKAIKLYEVYSGIDKNDFRIYAWLSDCYINTGEINKSIENWQKANHAQNHTSIDFAIYSIYGKTDQIQNRDNCKTEIAKGKSTAFYPLIFLDENWEFDWWNSKAQEYFLTADIALAKTKLGAESNDVKILEAYIAIKKLEREKGKAGTIRKLLQNNNLILDNKTLPQFAAITSDLLRICFINGLLSEKDFYHSRGQDLLNLAKNTNDKESLNIYAYLQATVDGKVKPEIDLAGWKEFKDERFAISYFIGKADKNKYDDKELEQALADFPNSAKLYWVKTNCAKIEGKELKPHLVELIKREFKTLGSDEAHFSNQLNSYFGWLSVEK